MNNSVAMCVLSWYGRKSFLQICEFDKYVVTLKINESSVNLEVLGEQFQHICQQKLWRIACCNTNQYPLMLNEIRDLQDVCEQRH